MSELTYYTGYTGTCLSPHVTQLGWYERQEYGKSSWQLDKFTWGMSYYKGYRKPNYPMPARKTDTFTDYVSYGWLRTQLNLD